MSEPYKIIEANPSKVPIIISIPHCGISFPDELIDDYLPEQVKSVDDTDWFLQDLNDFASEMGITVIHAVYNRWVIDLNRDPKSAALYNDGRIITGLTTTTDFLGESIYKEGKEPNEVEVERRLDKYYWPYYKKIEELLAERKAEFGEALLWDAHSIRESVPTIQADKFPEMILGNNDKKSSRKELINIALYTLNESYSISHNTPFKGGHITRYFGDPSNRINALQLERNKRLYMDDLEREFHVVRANKMRVSLKKMFKNLIEEMN